VVVDEVEAVGEECLHHEGASGRWWSFRGQGLDVESIR